MQWRLAGAGRIDEAEQRLRSMADDYPQDTKPLWELHAIMKELGRGEDALEAIEEAVRRDPTDLELLMALASQRLSMLQGDAAEDAYRQIPGAGPGPRPGESRPGCRLRTGQPSRRAGELARRRSETRCRRGCSQFHSGDGPPPGQALRRRARGARSLCRRIWRARGAITCSGSFKKAPAITIEAFAAFTRMNASAGRGSKPAEERASAYRDSLRMQIETVDARMGRVAGATRRKKDDRPSPVFLVGFPRSGTTLLDTMLMGHPGHRSARGGTNASRGSEATAAVRGASRPPATI